MKICPVCDQEFEDELKSCPEHDVDLTPVTSDPLLGSIIQDKYKICEFIGRGSMGAVYRAMQKSGGKQVALKVLHTHLTSSRESIKRFHHEVKAASRLQHPHIVQVYDSGVVAGGQPYIAMELLDGVTLLEYMKERKRLPPADVVPIIRQVCEALAEAHSHGVLHRDIKPANIVLVNRFGQENFVVVVDFSIAKVIQRVSDVDSTTPGLIFGSPTYMSPERFLGTGGDFRSDIYSLGVVMYQMLAGVPPFRSGDLYSLMSEHVKATPPPIKSLNPSAEIPPELEETIMRALAKRPEDRQKNVKEFLSELISAARDLPVSSSGMALGFLSMERTTTPLGSDDTPQMSASQDLVAPEDRLTSEQAVASAQENDAGRESSLATESESASSLPESLLPQAQAETITSGNFAITQATTQGHAALSPAALGTTSSKSKEPLAPGASEDSHQAPVAQRPLESGEGRLLGVPAVKSGSSQESIDLIPYVLLVGTLIAVIVLICQLPTAPVQQRAEVLINQGKLDDAGHILEIWRGSKLSAVDQEKFDRLCLRLAKEYARIKRYPSAIVFLEQISMKSRYYLEARELSRRYRKLV